MMDIDMRQYNEFKKSLNLLEFDVEQFLRLRPCDVDKQTFMAVQEASKAFHRAFEECIRFEKKPSIEKVIPLYDSANDFKSGDIVNFQGREYLVLGFCTDRSLVPIRNNTNWCTTVHFSKLTLVRRNKKAG